VSCSISTSSLADLRAPDFPAYLLHAPCCQKLQYEMCHLQVADSEHIDADRLLRLLPVGQLLEIRALLLEHFGRHQEILR
jgi:hypothetical protein